VTFTASAKSPTFVDVPATHPFMMWIEALVNAGITSGCATSPPQYCPDQSVTRGQMAVFLLRGIHGAGHQPPDATGIFADVPLDHPFARWIEQLFAEGITSGCATSPARYCPDQPVTRGQTAVFLVRAFGLPVGSSAAPDERDPEARRVMRDMPQYSTAVGGRSVPSQADLDASKSSAATALGTWTPLGPSNISGRTLAMLIDPLTPTTMYAGGVLGGVWKSTSSGASWVPLTDSMANLAVNSMAMNPADTGVIYAGTGEGYFNGDAVRGAGIFKTTDAGATWAQLTSTNTSNFYYVNKIAVSPNNSNRVYAATRTGLFRSLDAGATWTQVLSAAGVNGCLDLVIRSDQGTDYMFAACGTFAQGTVYRNTDAGGSGAWAPVLSESGMGRTSLALAPSSQSTVYALASSIVSGDFFHGLHAVFRSTDEGMSWVAQVRNTSRTKLNTVLLTNPVYAFYFDCYQMSTNQYFNQGWYNNAIAVDPVDPNRVWVGGIDLFRSDDGGANWGMASHWWASTSNPRYVHADQHTIVFHPAYDGTTNKTMFVGNDGGLFRTTDARAPTAAEATAACTTSNGSVNWTPLNKGTP
jgi:photosystem II stability/assembly factor-like uncharacterized protein